MQASKSSALSFTEHGLSHRLQLQVMRMEDVDQAWAIEQAVYKHPWSRNNFVDSLLAQYDAWVLRTDDGRIIGYVLVLLSFDESHLLNVAVCQQAQGQGLGQVLLRHAVAIARAVQTRLMVLEVRPSNTRALEIYRRFGFVETRRRKDYYPASDGKREDAVEMMLTLEQAAPSLAEVDDD